MRTRGRVGGTADGGHGVELSWRPFDAGDAEALVELRAAAESVDRTGEHYAVEDVLEELANPRLDLERDTVAAFAGRRMVACGMVRGGAAAGGEYRVYVDGTVHPDHRRRGLGREVLERTARRAAELRRERHPDVPGVLQTYSYDQIAGAAALFLACGLEPVRRFYDMSRGLTDPPRPAPVPDGVRLVGYRPELDEAVRVAHNEAFAQHWASAPADEVRWRQAYTGSRAFRPGLSILAVAEHPAGDEIAGHLLSYVYETECEISGVREAWVGQLGTRPRWRGRGVGSALLTAALRGYAAASYQRASLGVDTGNETGALGLYQRVGFTVTATSTRYRKPLR